MIKRIVIATFVLCLLAACGNKGPLVMPSPAAASAPPAVPATPAEPADADSPPAAEPESDSGTPARS